MIKFLQPLHNCKISSKQQTSLAKKIGCYFIHIPIYTTVAMNFQNHMLMCATSALQETNNMHQILAVLISK